MFTRMILVTALVMASAGTAFASELAVYSSRTTWNTDKAGVNIDLAFTNMTFEAFAGSSFNDAAGLLDAITNVRFVGLQSNGSSYDLTDSLSGFSGSAVLTQSLPNGSIQVTLPANVRAFGVDVNSASAIGVTIDYTAGGNFTHLATPAGTSGFFGVRTDAPITNLVLYTGVTTKISVDNFEIGTQADTPEVATLLLIGTGLIAMRWLRRRQRQRQLAVA